ncbi:hypothetical protein J7L09_00795, partial [bacterium]|nr:hypothetical protein [bacterium]
QAIFLNSKILAISKYQEELGKLLKDNKNLEISLSNRGSVLEIEKLAQNLDFERIDNIHYLKIAPESVAKK